MQIYLLLLIILAILLILVSKKESLSNSVKITIIASVVSLFLLGWLYTTYSQDTALSEREIINAFEQGKVLKCGDYKVDSSNFIFVNGTLSFVAKQSVKELKGVVIDISTCKP